MKLTFLACSYIFVRIIWHMIQDFPRVQELVPDSLLKTRILKRFELREIFSLNI